MKGPQQQLEPEPQAERGNEMEAQAAGQAAEPGHRAAVSLAAPVLATGMACLGYFGYLGAITTALWWPLASWWSAVWPSESFLRVRSVWPLMLMLPLLSPMTLVILPVALAVVLPFLPLFHYPVHVLQGLGLISEPSVAIQYLVCVALLLVRIQILRFLLELTVTVACNRVPSLRELFAKPLHPPKLVSFAACLLHGDYDWTQIPEGSVQLRPMAALWGGPAIRLRGIHVNPQSKQAKSALATAPFMLEWLQLGIMEIYLPTPQAVLLPTPLSPGVKLTVKDVYLRMRTYDFHSSDAENERLEMAWANATSAKLGKIAAAWGVILDGGATPDADCAKPGNDESDAASAPTRGHSMVERAISRVIDASEMKTLNVEVVVCGGKHPSLAVSSLKHNTVDAESEVRVHLHRLVWAKAPANLQAQSHGGFIASPHEFRYEQDVRVDGTLFFKTDFSMIIDVDMQDLGVPNIVDISCPVGMTLHVWPRQIALLNNFMGWMSHANCVMQYASQRCSPNQPVRPRKMTDTFVQHVSDGIVAVETRYRAEDELDEEDRVDMKDLTFAELDGAQRDAALRLGCGTAKAWDAGESVVWLKSWDELTFIEKKAATELGLTEWNWDGDDGVQSRQSLSHYSLADVDTRMAALQSMEVELKRINARRLWDYALRCVRYERAARAQHYLFRRRVLKNRTEARYISLWRRQQNLEKADDAESPNEFKTVQEEIKEIEAASHSVHELSTNARFLPDRTPLLDYAEIIHCRKVARADEDVVERSRSSLNSGSRNDGAASMSFDPAPPTSVAALATGPVLRASLEEFRLVLASPRDFSMSSEVAEVCFVLGKMTFTQHFVDGVTKLHVGINKLSMGVVSDGQLFNFVKCNDPKSSFLRANISMQPLLMDVNCRIGCVTCLSDLRPVNFLNTEMSVKTSASPLAVYSPLFPKVSDADESIKFQDHVVELQRDTWKRKFDSLSDGHQNGVPFSTGEIANMACRLIIESVGETAQQEYDSISKHPDHPIDWVYVKMFAERVGYMHHDSLQLAFENATSSVESAGDEGFLEWDRFCAIMTSIEKAHQADRIAAEHPSMSLDVRITSPQVIFTRNPESDTDTQLLLELGNIVVATYYEAELVVVGVDREVMRDGSDQQTVFIRSLSSDIASALGVPVSDVCHVAILDASVPAPEGAEFAELRHLLRQHRDEYSLALRAVDFNNDGFLDSSEIQAAFASLSWDVDESEFDRYCKAILDYLDTDHDGKVSVCELKDDLASNRAIYGRTDCLVSFSLRPRDGASAASYVDALRSQAVDATSKLRNGAVTKNVEHVDLNVSDGTQHTGHQDSHFFDSFHVSWTDFQVSLEKRGGSPAVDTHWIRDILVSKFDVHTYVAACFLPDFLLVGQPHLARTKARVEMSSVNIQASMQNISDIQSLMAAVFANMDSSDDAKADAAVVTPDMTQPVPVALQQHDFKELDVEASLGAWTVRLNHATKRPILDLTTQFRVHELTKQAGAVSLNLGINLSAQYDNLHVGHWEPVLEPWHLSVKVLQSARAMEVTMSSQEMMNINVSHSLMQNVMGSMNVCAEEGQALESQSAFTIENHLGATINVRLGRRERSKRSVQFYHSSREILSNHSVEVDLEEMRSVRTHEILPVRVLRVEFSSSSWKSLVLSNLNRAAVTQVLLHKRFENAKEDTNVRRNYPRRQPSHHDKALVVAAAHTAQRSTVVHFDNQSPFMFVRDSNHDEDHWTYGAHPPHSIAPNETVIFASESHSILAGTEGKVKYRYVDEDSSDHDHAESIVTLHWVNPIFGEAKAWVGEVQGGDQMIDVEIVGPDQLPCNEVTFVLRKKQLNLHDDADTVAPRHDTLDQDSMVCAVDVSDTGIKSIILCTKIQFQNDTEESLVIEFGTLSEKLEQHKREMVFAPLGSDVVHPGKTQYIRIELCTAKYARIRPTANDSEQESDFAWCDGYIKLDEQDHPHTISCKGSLGIFHCIVSPSNQDPLDARQKWRVQPVRTLVNLLPCSITAHLYSSEKSTDEMMFGTARDDDDAASGLLIEPGARVALPTMWPHATDQDAAGPKTAWLLVSKLGQTSNANAVHPVCVYVDESAKTDGTRHSQHRPQAAGSFPIQLESPTGSIESHGHATVGYEETQAGWDIVLYSSHWIVNKTGNAYLVRGTGENDTGSILVPPRQMQTPAAEAFGSVFTVFGVGNAPKPKATMLFKYSAPGAVRQKEAIENKCEVDVAQKVEAFEMRVGDEVTRCSIRVGLAEGDFWRTKVIEIDPLWVLVNQTSGPLTIVEHVNRPMGLQLTKSFRAVGTDDPLEPFTLGVGESSEVLVAPRARKAAYALRFALGKDTPIVEESLTIKVWEHQRRMISKGWGMKNLGRYPLSPLIPTPLAGGDPAHLVMEIPGGIGQPMIGKNDEPVRQVALYLNHKVSKHGSEWQWIDTWAVKKDIEHGGTDKSGWEYCDALSLGMKDAKSSDMCRQDEQWVGEYTSGCYFRRRCWTRTQRRYLTTAAQEAAQVESQIDTANIRKLTELCTRLGIWDNIPTAGRTKPGVLKRRLKQSVRRLTVNMWSPPCDLPLSGDTQLNIPTLNKHKRGSRYSTVCINVRVTATAQGTLLAVLTNARQPHFSVDNRSGIPLLSRTVAKQNRVWFDVPVSKGGECTDVWEGDAGADLQLKVHGSEDEGITVPMGELGEKEPWEVVYMTPQGPTTISLIPSVAIQREAKTLIVRRAAAKAQGGTSDGVGQFSLDVSLAGFGLSVINREPKELMYMSCSRVRLSQKPVKTLRVHASRLNNVPPSNANIRAPKLIFRLEHQELETAAVENSGGFINFEHETASFKVADVAGSAMVLEISCIDTANKSARVDGKDESEVLGRTQINLEKLKVEEKPFVEDWFELSPVKISDDVAEEDSDKAETLTAYLKLDINSTLDKPEIIEIGLGSFQLDNQNEHCDDPVVISPEPSASFQSYINIRIQRCTSLDGLTSQLERVNFEMAPTNVCINWEFLAPLIDFVGSLPVGGNSSFDGTAELCRQMELISRFDELAATSTAKPTKIYAKHVELSQIKLTATTKMQQFIKQMTAPSSDRMFAGGPLLDTLIRLIATVGVKFVEIVEAPIVLDSLTLPMKGQDPFTTQEALMGSINAHIMHQAVLIGLRVLGSTATIQGGTKLVGSVITGLEELGSGFRGLSDGDVVGVGVGVLGLGKNVAGGVLNAGNAVLGIAGDIAGTNAVTRHTVGALIGGLQKGLHEVSDAIDGRIVVSRNRYTRNFGLDDEMLTYSSSQTLGNKLLHILQKRGIVPALVADTRCLASVLHVENDKSYATVVTDVHVLQLVGPANGHKRPTMDVLESLRLVNLGSTSLHKVQRVYLESNSVCLTRTHGSNYARNERTDSIDEQSVELAQSRSTVKISAADMSMLIECFDILTLQLKALHPSGAYKEYRAPMLTVSVRAVDGLPKGRHAPKVSFVVEVPGALVSRYISADNVEDISPSFHEAANFVVTNYGELTRGKGVTLEMWDRNLLGDELVGTAELATSARSLNPLPSKQQFDMGATWCTNDFEDFVLEDRDLKGVGNVGAKLVLQSRIWKWEHTHGFKTGAKAVLAKISLRDTFVRVPNHTNSINLVKSTTTAEGTDGSLAMSGWLYKHWKGAHFSTRRRWFVLAADGSMSYATSDQTEPIKVFPTGSFHNINAGADVKQVELTCTHDDKHKDGVLVLEAANALEALQWKAVLDAAVAKSASTSPILGTTQPQATLEPTPKDVPSRVAVTIWSGHDLPRKHMAGSSDPYVECRVVSDCSVRKTKVKSNKCTSSVQHSTLEPVWDPAEKFNCVDNLGSTDTAVVRFKVWDQDIGRDELIGIAEMPLAILLAEPGYMLKQELDLSDNHGKLLPKGQKAGQPRLLVSVQIFYSESDSVGKARADAQLMAANVEKRNNAMRRVLTPEVSSSTGIDSQHLRGTPSGVKIHVRVLRATNIPTPDMSMSSPKTYVQLAYRDDRPQRTSVVRGNRNPTWLESEEEQHQFMVPVGAWHSRIRGSLWHRASLPPDDLLGTFELAVSEIQLEVSVITLKLTPSEKTTPMDHGEIPTVQVMCVRTEPSVYAEEIGKHVNSDDNETDEDKAATAAQSVAASTAGKALVERLRSAVDEIATANAARAVADLCYQTSEEGPLRRQAFVDEGGVEALVATLHVNAPTAVATKWVAEALRALTRENPKLAATVIQLDGMRCLEAIVQAGKARNGGTAAALEAQKTMAVLQVQKQQLDGAAGSAPSDRSAVSAVRPDAKAIAEPGQIQTK